MSSTSESDVAERRESATQKVIINRADIEKMGALTIGDVIGKLPGVDAGATGADGAMALRSRGMVRDSIQILIDGENITDFTEVEMMGVRKKMGMVFQDGALFDSLPVYDNVAYRLHEQGFKEAEVETEVRQGMLCLLLNVVT